MARRLGITSVFLLLAVPAALGTIEHVRTALDEPALRAWLIACYSALKATIAFAFATFVFLRAPARRPSREPLAFLACATAVVTAMALHSPTSAASTTFVLVGELVALAGGSWMLVSSLALGRCFSVLPEARGIVTHGPYRYIRHPLYLGELTIGAGLVIASPSAWNLLLAGAFLAAQAVRMELEERALSTEFPEYAAYAARTPRLIPGLGLFIGQPKAPGEGNL